MEKKERSMKFLKQRKFLAVLPLLVLPFVTLGFWALGGSKVNETKSEQSDATGLMMEIPDAILDTERPMDKMSYYRQADLESQKRKEQIRQDPYYPDISDPDKHDNILNTERLTGEKDIKMIPVTSDSDPEESEKKIYKKLNVLKKALNQPEDGLKKPVREAAPLPVKQATGVTSADIDRLEKMMGAMQSSDTSDDPELQQLGGLLDKILDIQHPERVEERLRRMSEDRKSEVFSVSTKETSAPATSLDDGSGSTYDSSSGFYQEQNGFYSLDDPVAETPVPNAIEAVVQETQTLVNGATVKLRLVNDAFIGGVRIPKDHFVFGTARISGDRLQVNIESIRNGTSLFPVSLAVYDMDGLQGIHIPGAISREVMKQSGDQSLQSLGMTSLDPSLAVQAASAGIQVGKDILSKKVKLVRVQVKAGYRVLLVDEKKNQNF